jgi:hypothetical protein
MVDQPIASKVVSLLAANRGTSSEEIDLPHRLCEDLGMSEREAAEFFTLLHRQFGTDLQHLHREWVSHFEPRLTAGCGVLYLLFSVAVPVLAFWASPVILLVLALVAGWYWISRKTAPRRTPITVAQVIAAAEAGSWPKQSKF